MKKMFTMLLVFCLVFSASFSVFASSDSLSRIHPTPSLTQSFHNTIERIANDNTLSDQQKKMLRALISERYESIQRQQHTKTSSLSQILVTGTKPPLYTDNTQSNFARIATFRSGVSSIRF